MSEQEQRQKQEVEKTSVIFEPVISLFLQQEHPSFPFFHLLLAFGASMPVINEQDVLTSAIVSCFRF
jgi:hypothetical protein